MHSRIRGPESAVGFAETAMQDDYMRPLGSKTQELHDQKKEQIAFGAESDEQ